MDVPSLAVFLSSERQASQYVADAGYQGTVWAFEHHAAILQRLWKFSWKPFETCYEIQGNESIWFFLEIDS